MQPNQRCDQQPVKDAWHHGREGWRDDKCCQVRYNRNYGALLVTASEQCINFSYYNRDNKLIDSYTMRK